MQNNSAFIYSTVKGTKSKENRDNYLVIDEDEYSIFAVFDGVSRARDGKQATVKAKKFIEDNYKRYIFPIMDIKLMMYELNQFLVNSPMEEPYSTYCLAYRNKSGSSYVYSWLGDSRIYIITNQFIEQLTEDDSYNDFVITKFLGNPGLSPEDFRQRETNYESAHLLLCTDGFYRIFESDRLSFFEYFQQKSLTTIKEGIFTLISGKNPDDSTYIFVK